MKAIGLLCGAGSLLHEARRAGCEIVANIETRPYFRGARWVWESNFPGIPMVGTSHVGKGSPTISVETVLKGFEDQVSEDWYDADIAWGHPPCGAFSRLGHTGTSKDKHTLEERTAKHTARRKDTGLIPLFADLVKEFHPKTFIFDNLEKMLQTAATVDWWEKTLPEYKFTFVHILNYDYGCAQRRKRLWVIGTRYHKKFILRTPEKRLTGPKTAWEAIRDLPWEPWENIPELAHVHHDLKSKPSGGLYLQDQNGQRRHAMFIPEAAFAFLSIPNGYLWPYITSTGRPTKKAGHNRVPIDIHSRVLTGGETIRHPLSGWPLTPRERARIMGWPDDFILWDGKQEWNRSLILKLVRLTGKAVPSEFPRYIAPQLMDHVRKIR